MVKYFGFTNHLRKTDLCIEEAFSALVSNLMESIRKMFTIFTIWLCECHFTFCQEQNRRLANEDKTVNIGKLSGERIITGDSSTFYKLKEGWTQLLSSQALKCKLLWNVKTWKPLWIQCAGIIWPSLKASWRDVFHQQLWPRLNLTSSIVIRWKRRRTYIVLVKKKSHSGFLPATSL